VWIDVTVPKSQKPGIYAGSVKVGAGSRELATLAIELEVVDAVLPDRPTKTMIFYDRSELDRRIGGGDAAEGHLWQLFHRHRLAPLHDAKTVDGVKAHLRALDGSAYATARGYEGAAMETGDGVLAIGAYGGLGAPSAEGLRAIESIADFLAEKS